MISGIFVRAVVVIASMVFVVGSWVTTGAPNTSLFSFFSVAVFIATVLLLSWDRWIWKWKLAQAIPGVSRNISGTWETRLETFWKDSFGVTPDPKTVYVVIRQTSSTTSVTLLSDESKSKSSLARLVEENGSWLLHYVYTNEPRLIVRDLSPIHHGSAVLSVIGSPADRLEGSYWTDRDSKGMLSLTRRSKKIADDFREAKEAFEESA